MCSFESAEKASLSVKSTSSWMAYLPGGGGGGVLAGVPRRRIWTDLMLCHLPGVSLATSAVPMKFHRVWPTCPGPMVLSMITG